MNSKEARTLLTTKLNQLRHHREQQWAALLQSHTTERFQVRGESGAEYRGEVLATWDDPRRQHIRVVVSLEAADGGALFSVFLLHHHER